MRQPLQAKKGIMMLHPVIIQYGLLENMTACIQLQLLRDQTIVLS